MTTKLRMLLLIFCLAAIANGKAAAPRPNILIIFTDDQGYADLGCFGSTQNKTPRLDQLAAEGTRFTSFYAQSVCGPSRSALLTGRYPDLSKGWGMPGSEVTFAELLKTAGYQTACIGKWDVSSRKEIIDRMPNAQGFDYYFGPLGANDKGIVHFHENNDPAGETDDMASLTRLYTEKAIDYLKNKRDTEAPFVLLMSHTMTHTVIDASPGFRGKSEGGLYGDVVEELDFESGRLLDTIETLDLRENTLIIFTTDNGPWCQTKYRLAKTGESPGKQQTAGWYMPKGTIFWGNPGPFRGGKGSAYEAGSRVPCIVRWPGMTPAGKVSDALWSTVDLLPTLAGLAGVEPPTDRIIDGIDQTSLITGKIGNGRETLIYTQNGSGVVGIRKGKWKLLLSNRKPVKEHRYLMDFGTNAIELYDLDKDKEEANNLAVNHPEVVNELNNLVEAFIKSRNKK